MGLFSTPTNEGASRIDLEYNAGTQEEWQHACPNCGEYHLIRYIDIVTESEEYKSEDGKKHVVVKSVKWRCPDCGFEFTERQMKDANQKYIAKNPTAVQNGIRSFFVNAFTSPWLSWKDIMREWLEAKGDPAREKVVVNTRFGESYREPGAFEDHEIFLRRREAYGAELPDGVLMLTAAVDTQDNRLEYEVCGWGENEESWGIKKGVILGKPDQEATWNELDSILDHTYTFADGTGLKILRAFIDSGGHYTGSVYRYCEKNFTRQRFAIKGYANSPGIPLNYKIGKASNSPIPLVILGVDDGKQQIMNRLAITQPGAQYMHFPLNEGEKELGNRGYDELYFKGIISEHKKRIKRNGVIREIWETTAGVRNEPLDLRVYNLGCMYSCNPNWKQLKEILLAAKTGRPVKPVATTQKRPSRMRKVSRATNIW